MKKLPIEKLNWAARESLIILEGFLDRKYSKTPVYITEDVSRKKFELAVGLENTLHDDIRENILVPACYHLANEVNKLNTNFDTFLRIEPEDHNFWCYMEYKGLSITITKTPSENDELLTFIIGVKESG